MIIAQQFTAGKTVVLIASPVGTTESRTALSIVPTGLTWHVVFGPSDKSLGYCRVSLRDKPRKKGGQSQLAHGTQTFDAGSSPSNFVSMAVSIGFTR